MLICCSVAGWTYKAPFHQNAANQEKYYLLYKSVDSKRVDYSVHPSWCLTKKDFFHIKEGDASCLKSTRLFDLHSLSPDFDVFLNLSFVKASEKRFYCDFLNIPARSRRQETVAASRNTVTRRQDDFKVLQNKLLSLETLIIQTGGL